jgi:hypothetical protein
MKIEILKDGTLVFDNPPQISLKGYQQDPNNPLVFRPKNCCSHRQSLCKKSACGKRAIFAWKCNHFKRRISLEMCEGCNARTE